MPAGREDLEGFLSDCRRMLMETTDLICEYFPQRNPDGTWQSDYVQERYREDWSAGHNLGLATGPGPSWATISKLPGT